MRSFRRGPGTSPAKPGSRPSRPGGGGGYGGPKRGRGFGGPRGGFGGRRGGGMQRSYIDIAKFVNKAEVTETAEHFVPEHAFADFAVHESLKRAVALKGYMLPTPIQDRVIPHILRGDDVVGIANTGTGKTAAFLIPLIQKVVSQSRSRILIVVPTRELALQIDEEFQSLVRGMRLFSVCCVGGARIGRQLADLRHYNHFVIGTPGRLKDLIERKALKLDQFDTVVLDEADRMLDMGFIQDVRFLLAFIPLEKRHTMFFSATLSKEIERLIGEFLKDPVRISVKTRDTAKNVDQDVVYVKHHSEKVDTLHGLLRQAEFGKVLVFVRTKHGADNLYKQLVKMGVNADAIHGDKNQSQRQRALDAFKKNKTQVLIATDVAARGLDIPDVTHVINYDLPATYDDYIHRIGRTGRADKKGKALTFVS